MPCSISAPSRSRSRPAAFGARVIHVSAIGADENSPSLYAQSKAQGRTGGARGSARRRIVRPSIVFGPEDDFFNRFAAMARFLPALPLVGGGLTRFQPVFAGDVAEAIANLRRDRTRAAGKTYEFGGPEVRTFRELMEYVLATTERSRLLMPLPFWLAKTAGLVPAIPAEAAADAGPGRAAAQRQCRVGGSDPRGRTLQGLGITPRPIEAIVPSYLWRFRKTGQFRTGRFA